MTNRECAVEAKQPSSKRRAQSSSDQQQPVLRANTASQLIQCTYFKGAPVANRETCLQLLHGGLKRVQKRGARKSQNKSNFFQLYFTTAVETYFRFWTPIASCDDSSQLAIGVQIYMNQCSVPFQPFFYNCCRNIFSVLDPYCKLRRFVATCNRGSNSYEPMFGSQMNHSLLRLLLRGGGG